MKKLLTILFAVALGLNLSAQDECLNPDVNCDGYVNVNDLLGLLGYFGDEDLDGDGIWDSQDDCVDDGCGVCDGPGPQVLAVDTITFMTDSLFVEALNEWYVFEVPDTTFTLVCSNLGCTDPMAENYDPYVSEDDGSCVGNGPVECGGVSNVNFDGYTYDLVAIGDQCWFAENLRATHFRFGGEIPEPLSSVYGSEQSCDATYADFDACDPNLSEELYGRLYSGYIVHDSICPQNWHLPSDLEWSYLTAYLGGSEFAGGLLKASNGWYAEGNGDDEIGFSGLPSGGIDDGHSFGAGFDSNWWTSTEEGDDRGFRGMNYSHDYIVGGLFFRPKEFKYAVRCVRD